MPMTLIDGQFRIVNAAPDGDSIRFYPNDGQAWSRLTERVRTNASGGAQLRLEGIDALETHYRPQNASLPVQNQPLPQARSAAAELLSFLGFDQVTRRDDETVTAADPAVVPGFILTRFADTYGRAVAFAFPGTPPEPDGSDVFFDAALLRRSANDHLLRQGAVYPTFYSLLYPDIRQAMAASAAASRQAGRGVWAQDASVAGFEVTSLDDLNDRYVILPKLFRRLVDYLALNDGDVSLAGFRAYVEQRQDRLIVLPAGHVTGFDFVIAVEGQRVRLTEAVENLVFIER